MTLETVATHLVDAIQRDAADAHDVVGLAEAVAGGYLSDYVREADWLRTYREEE